MIARTGVLAALFAPLTVGAIVIGFPLTASAYVGHQYWDGSLIQNQTKDSGTHSMSGGEAVTPGAPRVRITQSGVGSAEAYGAAAVTHSLRSTHSYCQWRMDWVTGTTYSIVCNYLTGTA